MDPKTPAQSPGAPGRNWLSDGLLLIGVACLWGGLALWSVPLAFVVAGVMFIGGAVVAAQPRAKKPT